jgi:hypothetical protein
MSEEKRREDGDERRADEDGDTGVEEHGDIAGATSTHAGAGGVMGNTGGTGTAPTGDS